MLKLSFGNVPASEVNSQKVAFILGCIMFLIVMVAPGCFASDTLTISASGATGSPDSALTIQPGNTVKFYSVSTAVDGKYSFQWQLNGSDIAGATGREYAISALITGDKISCKQILNGGNFDISISNQITVTVSNAILKTGATSIACTTPVVTIKADYCSVAGKVLLKATSTQNGTFLWSTGETTSNIFVDIVGNFSVKVTTPQGCVGTGSIQVGKELVVNGNFDAGNTGFTSPPLGANQYQYRADVAGNSELVPEGLYGIGTNAQNYHSNFWGYDHTTGSGNYMIINGFPNGSPQPIAWQEKVKVRPNIVYYFSAWGKSLNNVQPFAQLQFNVNGIQVGTAPTLPTGVNNNSNGNWTRFYGTLTTGPTDTTAIISITDLQNATGGNDFGLDDISFGTLATFIQLESAPGTDSQTVCVSTPLTNIVYSVGSTDSVPVISGLPPGLTTAFDGIYFTISGSPGAAGKYPYTITTSGTCNRTSASGIITVRSQSISLNSQNSSPSVCINTPVNIQYTLSGAATSATVSGLPNGVTFSLSGNSLTISGTPTVAGSYSYTITSSGTCAQATAGGTITVKPIVSIATVAQNATLCPQPFSSLSTSFSVAADAGTSYQWQENAGSTWTNLSNGGNYSGVTSNTLTVNNISESMDGYQYRTLLSNASSCYLANSVPDSLMITNVWKGAVSSDWSTTGNWWGNVVPDINCQYVVVPNVSPKPFPILTGSESQEVRNLVIRKNATVSVMGSSTLKVRGGIYADMTNVSYGYLDATDGRIELTGGISHAYTGADTAQIIAGSLFKTRTIKDLRISNPLSASVKSTSNDTLNITGTLSFGPVNNTTLYTGDNITLISGPSRTAAVADITNNLSNSGNAFNGNVVVERYINTGTGLGQHGKAWEFLAVPTSGQTVNQSWMESGSTVSKSYGTQITGPGGTKAGFDLYSAAPSMKFYNPGIPTQWQGIANPGISIYNPNGYMLFVRGDRSIPGPFTPAIPTRLRTKGKLLTYKVTVPLQANAFTSVGNPYASSIDMTKVLAGSPDMDKFFTVWATSNYGTFGYGSYVTYSQSGSNFVSTPGGVINNSIQSGQAFFVQSMGGKGGNIIFNENSKTGGSSANFTIAQIIPSHTLQMRTNLYGINSSGEKYLVDGTLQEFSDNFNEDIDREDGMKMFNIGENLDILKGNKHLIIERTKIPTEKDTLFFSLTGTAKQNYRFEFISKGLSTNGVAPFLEDNYLHVRTPIHMEDTTLLDFNVSDTKGSYASNRFYIVFKSLPVTISSVRVQPKGRSVQVDWKVMYENNVQEYEVERSVDGIVFTRQKIIIPIHQGNSNYFWLDENLLQGYYYYRIRYIDNNGVESYTAPMKVLVGNCDQFIIVSPNPVTDGLIHLQMVNMPAGKYKLRLLNFLGEVIFFKKIECNAGNNMEIINPGQPISRGVYQMQVSQPGGEIKVIKILF